jgi:tetratricopeptide (TPR) repeat protein
VKALYSSLRGEGLLRDDNKVIARINPWEIRGFEDDEAAEACEEIWLQRDDVVTVLDVNTPEEARQRLSSLHVQEKVFTLFLPFFDRALSETCRIMVAHEMEAILTEFPEAIEKAGNRFHSARFPDMARLDSAIQLAQQSVCHRLGAFLRILKRRQEVIGDVEWAWSSIPAGDFEQPGMMETVRSRLVDLGSFRQLVEALVSGSGVNRFFQSEHSHPEIIGLPDVERGFGKWTYNLLHHPMSHRMAPEELAVWTTEIEAWKQDILELLATRPTGAYQAALRLVEEQKKRGHPQYAAMTLCDLAIICKKRGQKTAQMFFAEKAVRVNPHDSQCWNQLGDALKNNHRLTEALEVYSDLVWESEGNVVARNGRAEVLRDLNRLPEALACYEETIARHDDVVALCGRAEVLRDLNRLPEALACYEETIARHDSVVARNGRAEVLRDLNRLTEALACYEETIARHDDVVARNGRAEVLRDLNRLPEALACYEETIARHDDVVALCGRAEVLRDLNRLPEALACYEETIARHDDVVALCGRAEVLRDLNRLTEALACYEETIARHDSVVAHNGRAEVLRDLNRLTEALACYEETIARHDSVVARNGRAEVLRDLNRLTEALVCYEETIAQHPADQISKNGRAKVLSKLGRFEEALDSLPTVLHSKQDWTGYHMRGMVFMAMRLYDEALKIFENGCRNVISRRYLCYFQTSQAICLLRARRAQDALRHLPEASSGRLGRVLPVLRGHALAESGDIERGLKVLTPALDSRVALVHDVAMEIQARFITHTPPRHDLEWLFSHEEDLLVLSA